LRGEAGLGPSIRGHGTRVRIGERPPELDYIPGELLDEAIAQVESAGGSMEWTPEGITSYFSVLDDGSPIVMVATKKKYPLVVVHEGDHLLLWSELVTELEKEMPRSQAVLYALQLIDTPEGTWIAENRAVARELAAALKYNYIRKPDRDGRRFLPSDLAIDGNYPAGIALEHAIIYSFLFGDEFVKSYPHFRNEIEAVKAKLQGEIEFYVDTAVQATFAEWDRQIAEGHRNRYHKPNHLAHFIGLASPQSDAEWMISDVQLHLFNLGVDRYLAKHPDWLQAPPPRRPTASPPAHRPWWKFW
jgi:hypothetical protein